MLKRGKRRRKRKEGRIRKIRKRNEKYRSIKIKNLNLTIPDKMSRKNNKDIPKLIFITIILIIRKFLAGDKTTFQQQFSTTRDPCKKFQIGSLIRWVFLIPKSAMVIPHRLIPLRPHHIDHLQKIQAVVVAKVK